MKIGLHYEMARPELNDHLLFEETFEQILLADKVGFDYVWMVEHHFLTGFSGSTSPEILCAALSKKTERIRLGLGVVVLPYHHPIRVAERVATLDHLANGRVDFGTGRSSPYELTGMGIDPSQSREMWEESLTMIPKIWESDWFEWNGKYWKVPKRQVLPKPYQKPHPPIWVAALQSSTYEIAAQKGIGVLAMGASDPLVLEPYIHQYHESVNKSNPVGGFINPQWTSQTIGICTDDNKEGRELGTLSIKNFFGPDRPYAKGQEDIYTKLLKQWGGVPKHLEQDFARAGKTEDSNNIIETETTNFIGHKIWEQLDADTLCDRAVIIAGNPDSCIEALKKHEKAGVDQVLISMQTETVPHDVVMKSIELFGKYIIPEFSNS